MSYYKPPSGPVDQICKSFIVLTWLSMLLRAWIRGRIVRSLGMDDLTMLFTVIFYTVFCAVMIVITRNVKSEAFIEFQRQMLSTSFTLMMVAETFYVLTITMFKISLAIFFLRITIKPWQRRIAYTAMGVSTVYGVGYFFFVVFQCGYWTSGWVFLMRKVSGECATRPTWLALSYMHAAIVTLTDIAFAVLPIFLLRDSMMPLRDKWTVGIVLTLGTCGAVCSILRFRYIPHLAVPDFDKFIGSSVGIAQWSLLEPGIGLVANNLATMRPLLRIVTKKAIVTRENKESPIDSIPMIVTFVSKPDLETQVSDNKL